MINQPAEFTSLYMIYCIQWLEVPGLESKSIPAFQPSGKKHNKNIAILPMFVHKTQSLNPKRSISAGLRICTLHAFCPLVLRGVVC